MRLDIKRCWACNRSHEVTVECDELRAKRQSERAAATRYATVGGAILRIDPNGGVVTSEVPSTITLPRPQTPGNFIMRYEPGKGEMVKCPDVVWRVVEGSAGGGVTRGWPLKLKKEYDGEWSVIETITLPSDSHANVPGYSIYDGEELRLQKWAAGAFQ